MKTVADFLAKLDKLTPIAVVDGKVITEEGFELTLKTEPKFNGFLGMAVQVLMHVRKDGRHVQSWGSESNEVNQEMVSWFGTARSLAREAADEAERQQDIIAKELWNYL